MLEIFLKSFFINFSNLFNFLRLFLDNFINELLVLFLFLLKSLDNILVGFSLKRDLHFKVLKIIIFLNGLEFKILNFLHLSKILLLFQLQFFIEIVAWWKLVLFLKPEKIIWWLLLSLLLKNGLQVFLFLFNKPFERLFSGFCLTISVDFPLQTLLH